MAKTSVILPTRNRLSWLQRAVASVLNQSEQDWELLIIDDASEDGTWDWISSIPDQRVRPIRLVHPSERRVARNVGLAAATGEFALFLDDDDTLYPHALAALVSALMESPQVVASVGARFDVYDSTRVRYPHPKRHKELLIWQELIAGWMPAQGQYIVRVSALQEAGGWSERLETAEDYDLWLRLSRLGPVAFVPTVVMQATRAHPHKSPISASQQEKVRQTIDELRHDFVTRLYGPEQNIGERILWAQALWEKARQAYYEGRHAQALALLTKTTRMSPELFRSPILGPPLRADMMRSMAGLFLGKKNRRRVKLGWAKLRRIFIGTRDNWLGR